MPQLTFSNDMAHFSHSTAVDFFCLWTYWYDFDLLSTWICQMLACVYVCVCVHFPYMEHVNKNILRCHLTVGGRTDAIFVCVRRRSESMQLIDINYINNVNWTHLKYIRLKRLEWRSREWIEMNEIRLLLVEWYFTLFSLRAKLIFYFKIVIIVDYRQY